MINRKLGPLAPSKSLFATISYGYCPETQKFTLNVPTLLDLPTRPSPDLHDSYFPISEFPLIS